MKITKLEYQKKDPNRVNVYVDDKFIAGIEVNDVIKLDLYANKEITADELNKIIAGSEFGKLFNAALNFLSFRPRSEWEIRQFFRRRQKNKDYRAKKKASSNIGQDSSDNHIDAVIAKLRQIGQIDDAAFARWFTDQRRTFRPLGKRGLSYELIKKGLDRKLVVKVLTEQSANEQPASEEDLALKALGKRVERLKQTITDQKSRYQAKTKLIQFLLTRGFDYELSKEVVEKALKMEYTQD